MKSLLLMLTVFSFTLCSKEFSRNFLSNTLPNSSLKRFIDNAEYYQQEQMKEFKWSKKHSFYVIVLLDRMGKKRFYAFAHSNKNKIVNLSYDSDGKFLEGFLSILKEEKRVLDIKDLRKFFNLFTVYGKGLWVVKEKKDLSHREVKNLKVDTFTPIFEEDKETLKLKFYYLNTFSLNEIEIFYNKSDQEFIYKNNLVLQAPVR